MRNPERARARSTVILRERVRERIAKKIRYSVVCESERSASARVMHDVCVADELFMRAAFRDRFKIVIVT